MQIVTLGGAPGVVVHLLGCGSGRPIQAQAQHVTRGQRIGVVVEHVDGPPVRVLAVPPDVAQGNVHRDAAVTVRVGGEAALVTGVVGRPGTERVGVPVLPLEQGKAEGRTAEPVGPAPVLAVAHLHVGALDPCDVIRCGPANQH